MNRICALRTPAAAAAISLSMLLAACGSDAQSTDSGADGSSTTAKAAASTTAAKADTDDSEATEETAEGQAVTLADFTIEIDGPVTAGAAAFALTNAGENPHALAVAKGASYKDLPQKDNGAVDTEKLGADFIGSSENVAKGATGSVELTLEAGDYVFFCPIELGPNSHAKAGQVLSVTVK